MASIPRKLKSVVPIQEIINVENWWNKLSKANQNELQSIYQEEAQNQDQLVAIHLCGQFVEQETTTEQDVFWVNHFYEYLVNHELMIDESPKVGGICSANKAAENAIKKGMLKKDFICPHADEKCQMRKILQIEKRRKSLKFFLRFKLE